MCVLIIILKADKSATRQGLLQTVCQTMCWFLKNYLAKHTMTPVTDACPLQGMLVHLSWANAWDRMSFQWLLSGLTSPFFQSSSLHVCLMVHVLWFPLPMDESQGRCWLLASASPMLGCCRNKPANGRHISLSLFQINNFKKKEMPIVFI